MNRLLWGAWLTLALSACLLLGMPWSQPALAVQAAASEATITSSAELAPRSHAQAITSLSRPHQAGIFVHREEGWPRAALLLIVLIIGQLVILAFRKNHRPR